MRRHVTLTIASTCFAAMLAVPAMAAAPAHGTPAADARVHGVREDMRGQNLEDRVFVRLAEREWAGADFHITAQGDTVTIQGTVPNDAAKRRILRTVRLTPGVLDVRDEITVDPSVGASRTTTKVSDAELNRRVAQKIAGALAGTKAGEDWWFSGWRVEGPDNRWNLVVDSNDGRVTLDGDVPRVGVIRGAVTAALHVPGVQSVRSELDVEGRGRGREGFGPYAYGYPYGYPYGDPWGVYGPYSLNPGDTGTTDGFRGLHSMTGEVTTIDRPKGTLSLKTPDATLDLQFPPSALSGVNRGDRVTVELGLKDAGAVAASPASSR